MGKNSCFGGGSIKDDICGAKPGGQIGQTDLRRSIQNVWERDYAVARVCPSVKMISRNAFVHFEIRLMYFSLYNFTPIFLGMIRQ